MKNIDAQEIKSFIQHVIDERRKVGGIPDHDLFTILGYVVEKIECNDVKGRILGIDDELNCNLNRIHHCDCEFVGCHVNDKGRWCHFSECEIPYEKCNRRCRNYMDPKTMNDLNEASDEYADKHAFRIPYDGSDKYYDDVDLKASKDGFIAGAKWQKENMLGCCINGIMDCDDYSEWIEITDKMIVSPSSAGKKVKVVIIEEKENDEV